MTEEPEKDDFKEAIGGKRRGMIPEFLAFLSANKKWWLLPILLVFLLLGVFLFLSASGLAPLIYPLF